MTGPYELSAPEVEVLTDACRTLDTIDRLERQVERDGETVKGSQGQPRLHPAVTEVRGQRALLVKLLAALDLPEEAGIESTATIRARHAAESRWAGHTKRTG